MNKALKYCIWQITSKSNLTRHIRIALFVGLVLNFINQFDIIVNFEFDKLNIAKAMITFLVPFAVSVYSAATVKKVNPSNERMVK